MIITNPAYIEQIVQLKNHYAALPLYQRFWFNLWSYNLSSALSAIDLQNPTNEQIDALDTASNEAWFFKSIFGFFTHFKTAVSNILSVPRPSDKSLEDALSTSQPREAHVAPKDQIGRAAPASELLIVPEMPMLELKIPELNLQIERLNLVMNFPDTLDLRDMEARLNRREALSLPETEPYNRMMSQINRDLRNLGVFQNRENDMYWQFFRHPQQTARQEAYQWWRRQNPFASLPNPEDFRNASKLAGNPDLDIPEEFICAITSEIMTAPVYDPNFPQLRYDRHAIERWLTDHPTNPYTRAPLTVANLVADSDLKARIDEFVANALETSVALTP